MLKIMVVEKVETRRADFVDAICELPGVLACGAASGLVDALRILSAEPVDAVVVGAMPETERQQLTTLAQNLRGCDVISASDAPELVARIKTLRVRANKPALAHRPRVSPDWVAPVRRSMQTLVLKDWLPALCAGMQSRMPAYVELVPIIAADAPPVCCVPEVLEHEVLDIVLEAAEKLPWGGTIWLTVERTSTDTVRIDVLENGLGTGDDVTLRTATLLSS